MKSIQSPLDMKYMPQLDGVRAVAIVGVLISHFHTGVANQIVHFGRLGVILFFVLSGFLITRILIKERDLYISGSSPLSLLGRFYTRRALRIFPIYYLVIIGGALLGYAPVLDHLFWHLTYTSNFSYPFLGGDYGYTIHLWSLCVEEQFYLFWPFVVLFTPRNHLPKVIIGLIALGIAYKFTGSLVGFTWAQSTRSLFGCLDSLALGALLAIFWDGHDECERYRKYLIKISLWFGLPFFIGIQTLYANIPEPRLMLLYVTFVDFSASLFFVFIIYNAAINTPSLFGKLLSSYPFQYIGKISYGIYVYHFFLIGLLPPVFKYFGMDVTNVWTRFFYFTIISCIIASISWHFIEKPINSLKQSFPYSKKTAELHPYQGIFSSRSQ